MTVKGDQGEIKIEPLKGHPGKKLWVVTELYYPEETSTGYYMTKIAEGLAEDFEVRVLCGQPNYSARGLRAAKKEIHKGVAIFRAFGTTFDKNVLVFRLINMLTLSISIFLKALRHLKKGERVLVVTNPPSLPFIVSLVALFKGAPYILLIHDNYPEILVAAKKTGEKSIFVKILNFLNRWLYKYASRIIVVGRDMEELVGRKTAGLDIPLVTIQNWAELDQVEPTPREENILLKELEILDQMVFLYAGNMGYPNDLESIVECAGMLRDDPRFCFVFLGTGAKRKWLAGEIKKRKLGNIKLLDPRPRSEQRVFLNACDVALVSLVKKMWGVSMPSRTYNILAAGKPILALTDDDSELARVIIEERVGWISPSDDARQLFRTIRSIAEKREEFQKLGENARQCALQKYSLAAALEKYRNVLKQM